MCGTHSGLSRHRSTLIQLGINTPALPSACMFIMMMMLMRRIGLYIYDRDGVADSIDNGIGADDDDDEVGFIVCRGDTN